VKQLSSQCE
jgi:chromosome segregation ATPase